MFKFSIDKMQQDIHALGFKHDIEQRNRQQLSEVRMDRETQLAEYWVNREVTT